MDDKPPPPPPGPSPLLLGAIGLLLLIGGWKASTWVPPREGSQLYDEVRRMAGDTDLGQRLDAYRPRPPLEFPGRLTFFLGLGLFIFAGVRMARSPSPADPAEETRRRAVEAS